MQDVLKQILESKAGSIIVHHLAENVVIFLPRLVGLKVTSVLLKIFFPMGLSQTFSEAEICSCLLFFYRVALVVSRRNYQKDLAIY